MSSGDGKEVSCPETEGKTVLNPEKANLESKKDLPSEPVVDGSGDHFPPFNTVEAISGDTLENGTKILSEETASLAKNSVGANKEDSELENTESNVNQTSSEDKSLSVTIDSTSPSVAFPSNSQDTEKELILPTKPITLEGVSSLASEDVDSENQDEELVLKWDDDDEEDNLLLKDDEVDKNTDNDSSTPNPAEKRNIETDNIADDTLSKDAESITEVKSSEDDVPDDDQEDLLSEIDAQIAELGASISKAENEGLVNTEEANDAKILIKNNDSPSESLIPSVSTSKQVIEIDITEETTEEITKPNPVSETNLEDDAEKNEKTDLKVIDIDEIENKPEDDNEKTEMEIEDTLLKDDVISQKNSALVRLNTLKQDKNFTTADETVTSAKTNRVVLSGVIQNDIVEKSQEKTKDEMDIEISANTNLSLDQNLEEDLLKHTEMQGNSTKLDNDESEMDISNEDHSFAHDSSSSIVEKNHGVNKPNVMLEIPTQELIDLDESIVLSPDKEMSVDDHEIESVSVDSVKNEPSNLNSKSVLENDSVEKETNKYNVLEEQTALKSAEITDKKSPLSNLKDPKLNNHQVSDETVSSNKAVLLKDSCTVQDIEKSNLSDGDNSQLINAAPVSDIEINVSAQLNLVENQDKSTDLANLDSDKVCDSETLQDHSATTVSNVNTQDEINLSKVVTSTELKVSDEDPQPEDGLPTSIPATEDGSADNTKEFMDVQPSTSQEAAGLDPSDDAAEVTDSLGLLAESSRVRDEDDGDVDADGDDQETSEHDDDEDEFDPDDESSNQQTAEHSEEDTAQQSESDLPKTQPELETEVADSTTDADEAFDLLKNTDEEAVETECIDKETVDTEDIDKEINEVAEKDAEGKEFEFEISNVVSEDVKETDGDIDIEEDIVCEETEIPDNIEVEENEPEVDVALKDTADETATEEADDKELPTTTALEESQPAKTEDATKSPTKKKLEIAKRNHVVNIVDLESSSEDEGAPKSTTPRSLGSPGELTSVNISSEIEVMSSGDNTSAIVSKQGETVITVPKINAHHKTTSRLNTSEITIKTASPTEPTLVIPETTMGAVKEEAPAPKFGCLEVFNLDSDEEETPAPPASSPPPSPAPSRPHKCVNPTCSSAPAGAYYDARRKRRAMMCEHCLQEHLTRARNLVEGVKSGTPLLALEEPRCSQELVEISDSDSDDDPADNKHRETIGEETAGMLERDLADMINATWEKFKMDARLKEAQDELTLDLDRLERESAEVTAMLDSCQVATDKLRGELYATFSTRRHQLPAFTIYDTPERYFMCPEAQPASAKAPEEPPSNKRRLSSASESQAKKPAIPLGYTTDAKPEDSVTKQEPKSEVPTAADSSKIEDDKDVSVVTLSAESAPADLPPPGEAIRPPLQPGQTVYAMRSAFGYWIKANVLEVTPKGSTPNAQNFTQCRIKYENKTSRNAYKVVPARCLAYYEPPNVRMTIGTRMVAVFKDTTSPDKNTKRGGFSSGIVAEVPNPVNKYRYLVFFDDGYAQYVHHSDTRLVCESSALVWEEVHAFSREFVRQYLMDYPERPMVRLHTGQSLKTEWNGKWWLSRVLEVDASLVHVYFEQDKRTEWIYRGSTRLAPLYLELQAAEKHRARPLPRNRQNRLNMPYVEYTRLDEQETASQAEAQIKAQQEEIRRQRAVAKKSTTPNNLPPVQQPGNLDAVTSRVVYYTPKNAVKPYKMSTHTCGPKCKRTDVLALKDLRTYNPLAKPLLSGWERQIVRFKGHKEVMYRAPCGRRLRNMAELHRYLRIINSDMGVDLFDFGPNTHCLAEFVLNKCIVGKKDLSHGKENVPVPCVNYYDESLPEFCSYNTERTPTAGVPLNLDPEFLCGCDCTDDCQDKSKCACWRMTLEGARTIGMDASKVGYVYKRLPNPLPSGIYECNVRCKCKATCLNRVAQHPLQLKLQVFKTLNRGWGIRALNDVPKGSFLCIYAGNLLTDATANLDGLNEGDEYLAELDYIEVVEQMKEGYEDDIPEQDKKLDRKELGKTQQESESEESQSEEEASNSKSDAEDGDFEPGYIPGLITGFNKRLRKRDKKKQKQKKENGQTEAGKEGHEEDCITISDDEELREPSRFAAQAGMAGEFISKYRSVRTLFGKDEACYIMDAKVQGNIGRYLNHSCSPNVFVQNVFVDTHDPRFPWVAFFALTHIRAGTELTWNYNYDVGSVPGKALYCYCGAPNCRGRLL